METRIAGVGEGDIYGNGEDDLGRVYCLIAVIFQSLMLPWRGRARVS